MRLAAAMLIAVPASAVLSPPIGPADYGNLHYLYAGALGDQDCADRNGNGSRKRRFQAIHESRVAAADRWFATRYSPDALAAALIDAGGGPDTIDVRDCLMGADGEPAFRDTARFTAMLRKIEREMRSNR